MILIDQKVSILLDRKYSSGSEIYVYETSWVILHLPENSIAQTAIMELEVCS